MWKALLYMRRTHNSPYYIVDITYQEQIPIQEIGSRLGLEFDKQRKCFCPDDGCSDSQSKHRSAHITPKKNMLHCFVCNSSWNPFTLVGKMVFGYSSRECYTKDGIQAIGRYIGEDLGYGGLTLLQKEESNAPNIPVMPRVMLHEGFEEVRYVPLYQCFGLKQNPFLPVMQPVQVGIKERMKYEVDLSTAACILFTKGLDTMQSAYEFLSCPAEEQDTFLRKDYDELRQITENYLCKIMPLLDKEDHLTVKMSLCYRYIMAEDEILRARLHRLFSKEIDEVLEAMAGIDIYDLSIEEELDYDR